MSIKPLAVGALLLLAVPSHAQQGTTAELTGRVTVAGQALQGAAIGLTSESLQAERNTTTGESGGYRFTLLPPADYLVLFTLQGFTSARKRVHLTLGETARVDVELTAAAHDDIVVTPNGRHSAADASVSTNIAASVLRQLPGPRDIRGALQLSSNVNTLGIRNGLVIAGAPSWDSLFLVDGVPAGEYLSGQPHDAVLEDAIQEVVVLTGAISAEYGRFTGGVVSTLTKSGGNEFDGSLRDTMTNAAWTVRTPWPGQPSPLDNTNHAMEATGGGFVLRDRLWFFAAARSADTQSSHFTALTNIPYASSSDDTRVELKLTNQVTPRHQLVVSFANAILRDANVLDTRSGSNVVDLSALIPERSTLTRLLSLTYNGIVERNTAAEVQYSEKKYDLTGNGGRSRDQILGTVIVSRGGNSNAPFGCGICGDDERDARSLAIRGSTYHDARRGNHTLSLGAEALRERRTNAGTRSSSDFNIQATSLRIVGANAYPFFGPTTLISFTPHHVGDRGSDLGTISGFVNERWQIGSRATVNFGLRYDRNRDRDAVGRWISDDGALSPRVRGIINLRNDGRQQLLASYGRYAARILEGGGASQQVGIFDQYGWSYGGPPINGSSVPENQLLPAYQALERLFAWFNSAGGINNRQNLTFITTPDTTSVFHGSLKSPSVDERSIGYHIQSPAGFLAADYVARDWHNFYAERVDHTTGHQSDSLGDPIDVAWVVNDNSETVRTYRAVQLDASWHRGRIAAGGGYTWSKLRGNDDEEGASNSLAPRNLPLSLWYPELLGYPQRRPVGDLPEDQRHRARFWVIGRAAALTAAVVERFDSGHPYSAVAEIDPKPFVPNSGYSYSQVSVGPYYFSKRGAFRTDDVFSTDVTVQYEVPIHFTHAFAKLDVMNVLDGAAVTSPDTTVMDAYRNGAQFVAFNPFTTKPVNGVNYRLGPNFGKPTGPESYQQPRTFRVAIGARF